MENKYRELESDRLIYRKVKVEDAKILWDELLNDYEKYKYYESINIQSYEDYLETVKNQIARYEQGNFFRWAICEKSTGNLIGNILLHSADYNNNNIKIGYFIIPSSSGKGYASESVQTITNFVMDELKIHRLSATVGVGNEPSEKVISKAGFEFEALQRETHKINDKYLDSKVYVKINTNY